MLGGLYASWAVTSFQACPQAGRRDGCPSAEGCEDRHPAEHRAPERCQTAEGLRWQLAIIPQSSRVTLITATASFSRFARLHQRRRHAPGDSAQCARGVGGSPRADDRKRREGLLRRAASTIWPGRSSPMSSRRRGFSCAWASGEKLPSFEKRYVRDRDCAVRLSRGRESHRFWA
jgi:hypothetical protein